MDKPVVLCIDDDISTLTLLQYLLGTGNYTAIVADKGSLGIELARDHKPDVILLDVEMPEMNGYEVCLRLQKNPQTAYIPVVFLSSNKEEQDRKKAFAAGAADFMTKPFHLDSLLHTLQLQLQRNKNWQQLKGAPQAGAPQDVPSRTNLFEEFKNFAALKLQFPPGRTARWSHISMLQIYDTASDFGITRNEMARLIAEYMKVPYVSYVSSGMLRIGVIPASFSRSNTVIAAHETGCDVDFILSNPFDLVLQDTMKRFVGLNQATRYAVTSPDVIAGLFDDSKSRNMPATKAEARLQNLLELGITDKQAATMTGLIGHDHGLILFAGPEGSGKTTTIYSLLACFDCRKKNLITVEDPIEYIVPFANQQQVDDAADMTFAGLLKAAVRQNPDILFAGELRDAFSAQLCMDFARSGHCAISKIHASNSAAAISYFESHDISRATMAGSIIAIVEQHLLRKLCNDCKIITPVTSEERALLSRLTDDIPAKTAHPGGCEKCDNTGYLGREGVYEVLCFDQKSAAMLRDGAAFDDIRRFFRTSGGFLVSDHALDKVIRFSVSLNDVHTTIFPNEPPATQVLAQSARFEPYLFKDAAQTTNKKQSVLIVDDDPTALALMQHYLSDTLYEVISAGDGIDALLLLGQRHFDIIISDISMPNLDGFKLLDMLNQKGLHIPVILVSESTCTDDEIKALELGAADYIRKPIHKDALLARTGKVLGARRTPGTTL